ncbi:AMP-binding protein [Candidatus Acetothermia bacterium]|nr:AMP-binding protein [Candidatus Acetothermia bacterium]
MGLPKHYDEVEMSWVGDWVGQRARITPQREAVYDPSRECRYTYAKLNERANRVGAYLIDSLSLNKGDIVCVISRNRVEFIDLYFAAGKTGIILSPLSYRLAKPELDDLLTRIQPQALFYEDHFEKLVDSLTLPSSVRTKIVFGDEDSAYESKAFTMPARDVATGSGGTGIGGKELVTFPFFHIGGWNTVTPLFHIGGEVVLMREFTPDLALELIDREQITHFGGVEAMFRFMIASPKFKQTTFKSVKYINSAGAPCSAEVMQAFWDKGIPVTQSYGLTEAGPSNFILLPDGYSMDEIKQYSHSIGFPMFHCDAKIIDPQTRKILGPGQTGELCFRSPHSFEGYLNDSDRTAKIVDDEGWVHSGDLAEMDKDGYVRIVGRADNMFISGGENVSPEEIEQALIRHPAVAQVGAVGIPDGQWGQVALAVVVLKSEAQVDEEALKKFCRSQIASFKVPKHIRFAEALPLTGAGKVDRKSLKNFYKGVST